METPCFWGTEGSWTASFASHCFSVDFSSKQSVGIVGQAGAAAWAPRT